MATLGEKIRRLLGQELNKTEIARRLGVSRQTVHKYARDLEKDRDVFLHFFQTCRAFGVSLIFTTPDLDFLDKRIRRQIIEERSFD